MGDLIIKISRQEASVISDMVEASVEYYHTNNIWETLSDSFKDTITTLRKHVNDYILKEKSEPKIKYAPMGEQEFIVPDDIPDEMPTFPVTTATSNTSIDF